MAKFRLYDGRTVTFLGAHRTVEAAHAAADAHSLATLAAVGDWVVVEHVIAYDDENGVLQIATEQTHVGPPDDLEGCREWLRQLPGRRGARPSDVPSA